VWRLRLDHDEVLDVRQADLGLQRALPEDGQLAAQVAGRRGDLAGQGGRGDHGQDLIGEVLA